MLKVLLRILIFVSVVATSLTATAQNAQFSGRVTDAQGAVIQGAEVRVVNQATGIEGRMKPMPLAFILFRS